MTKTKDFIEKTFLDSFEKAIDTQLLFNFKNNNNIDSTTGLNHIPDPYQENSKEFLTETFNHIFLKNGILGILIFDKEINPILTRDYVINQKFIKQIDYYQRIVLTFQDFNRRNVESIIDIGLDNVRIMLKTIDEYIVCLIISDSFYWSFNERKLRFFFAELLKNIHKSISPLPKFTFDSKNNAIHSQSNLPRHYALDNLLFTNLQSASKHINNQQLTN